MDSMSHVLMYNFVSFALQFLIISIPPVQEWQDDLARQECCNAISAEAPATVRVTQLS